MSIMDYFRGYRKTNYEAGGCVIEDIPLSAVRSISPSQFIAPKKIDFRDMCLESSNQGQSPHCTGYGTAGFIEVQNWRKRHYPEQVDGDAIYTETKRIDGHPNVQGSWVNFAVQAAINLKLVEGRGEAIEPNMQDFKFAIHEFGVCISCFMITDDWNKVDSRGRIFNSGDKAKQLGGHCVLGVGYDEEGVYIQNSWSTSWGLYGFALLGWEQFNKQFMNGMVIRS